MWLSAVLISSNQRLWKGEQELYLESKSVGMLVGRIMLQSLYGMDPASI